MVVGFDDEVMNHNKELDGIDLTCNDQTNNNPADPVKKPGFCEIGGSDTVDQLNNQQLMNNTAANTTSFL